MARTPIEVDAMAASSQEFVAALDTVVIDLQAMFEAKGEDYDQLTPVWHRMMFGNVSWAHEIIKKADRLASLVMVELEDKTPSFDSLQDNVMDIAVYAIMWLAFQRVCELQTQQVSVEAVEADEASQPQAETRTSLFSKK